MKKKLTAVMAAVLALSLTACSGGTPSGNETQTGASRAEEPGAESTTPAPAGDAEIVLQLGHPEAEDAEHGIHHRMSVEFANRVAEYSGGRIEIEIYGNNQLGAERDLLEGMQMGTVDMASTANLIVGNFDQRYGVFDLPYLFDSPADAYKVLDSDYVAQMNETFAAEKGIRVLAFGSGGYRQLVTKGEVLSMADLNGMKIRVPENDIYRNTFDSLGANSTVMAWSEVFTGLQQNTIDGFEIATPVIYTSHFYEVCDYVTVTNHFFSPDPFMISEQVWQTLSAEDQEILLRAAGEAAQVERQMVEDYQAELFKNLEEEGMTINEIDLTEFKEATAGVIDGAAGNIGRDVIDSVREILGQ